MRIILEKSLFENIYSNITDVQFVLFSPHFQCFECLDFDVSRNLVLLNSISMVKLNGKIYNLDILQVILVLAEHRLNFFFDKFLDLVGAATNERACVQNAVQFA